MLGVAIDDLREGVSNEKLLLFAGLTIGIQAVDSGLRYITRILVSGSSRKMEYDLRNDVYAHLQRLDQKFFHENQTGDLLARVSNDVTTVREFLGPGLMDLFRSILLFAAGLVIMLTINVKLALLAAVPLPLITLLFICEGRVIERRYHVVQTQFGNLATFVTENFSGARVIKAYVQEENQAVAFERELKEFERANVAWARLGMAIWPMLSVLIGLSTLVVIYVGALEVQSGAITLGQFVQFNAYITLLAIPMVNLGWTFTMYQQAAASMARVEEVLARKPAVADLAGAQPLPPIRGSIGFERVSFGYFSRPVLIDVTLDVPAGTTLAIVGATGSGKTTLVNLIARVYDVRDGRVTVDGTDVREIPLAQLQAYEPERSSTIHRQKKKKKRRIAVFVDVAFDPPQVLHDARHELRLGRDHVRQQPFEPEAPPLGPREGDGLVLRLVPDELDGFLDAHQRSASATCAQRILRIVIDGNIVAYAASMRSLETVLLA